MDRAAGDRTPRGLTRRALLRDGGALTLAVFVARDASALGSLAVPVGEEPVFLEPDEMGALRALVDRFVPGRPEDVDAGAVEAGCAEAIDSLLGAFSFDRPRIYAGGPFSDRAGSSENFFDDFVELDAYEQKAWKLRIQGSEQTGVEVNGPVKGFQAVYRDGLAALDRAAAPARFADLPGPARDAILRTSDDPAIDALVDVAFPHTLQFMYGAPEYGGNQELVAWSYTRYQGDVQPRGWTKEEVEQPDTAGVAEAQPRPDVSIPLEELIGLASPEMAHGIVVRSGNTLSGLRAETTPLRKAAREARRRGR